MEIATKNKKAYYDLLINYIERNIPQTVKNTFRDKILLGFLAKYTKTLKAISILDELGYFEECDILIRSLYEIVVELAYLELNPEENYERLELYSYYEERKMIDQLSKAFNVNPDSVQNIKEIDKMFAIYQSKKYKGNDSYWNGLNIKETAKIVDKTLGERKDVVPLEELYFTIYKINCLFSHNSVKIIKTNYLNCNNEVIEYNIEAKPNEKYLHSCNYAYLISYDLVKICLPNIFKEKTTIFEDFNNYVGIDY